MKKTFALLCCVAMLLTVLVGCKKNNTDPADTGDSVTSDVIGNESTDNKKPIEYDEKGFIKDYIPEGLNYNNKDVKIVGWNGDHGERDFETDFSSGQGIEIPKATYDRNNKVEDRLKVKLDIDYTILGNNSNRSSYISTVEQNMITENYDIIACYSQCAANFAIDGYTVDLMQYSDIFNFDMPWWSTTLAEESMVNNRLYFASGAISTTNILQTFCIAVNLDMLDSFDGKDDPRELVKDKKWTMEAFEILCKDTYKNANDENPNKDSEDEFGFVTGDNVVLDGFYASNGLRYYDVDDEGKLIVSEKLASSNTDTLVNDLKTKFNTNDYYRAGGATPFTSGRAMLYATHFDQLMEIRSKINFNYGYVPYPTAEEGQDFRTVTGYPFTMWCMTNANENDDERAEMVAYVIECMASESYRKVQPAVYDLIKYKNNDDPVNVDMFEILLESKVYDLGRLFINTTDWEDSVVGLFRAAVAGTTTGGWLTSVEGIMPPTQAAIDSINNKFGF